MIGTLLALAWYRFRVTFAAGRGGYLAILRLVGVGGLAVSETAGSRRTQSCYPVYLASTDPLNLDGVTSLVNPSPDVAGLGYDPCKPKSRHSPTWCPTRLIRIST